MKNFYLAAKENYDYMVKIRRYLHQNPELSLMEYNTSSLIKKELEDMDIKYKEVGKTGIVGIIEGKNKKNTIGIRADIDALSINELNNTIPYRSVKKNVMHACGHDGHTASLLGAAKILKSCQKEINGSIKLIFEPGEEIGGTFDEFEKSGYLDDLDHVLGLHISSGIKTGKLAFDEGARMAATDLFTLKIHGKGAHASEPHRGIDAVLVSSAIVMNLQSIVSRELSPLETAVVTIGKLTAGQRFNSIADQAVLQGNLRSFNPMVRDSYMKIIKRIAKNTAKAYRAECEITQYFRGTPALVNEKSVADFGKKIIKETFSENSLTSLPPLMGGEDFSKFIEKYSGGYLFVGGGFDDERLNFSHHSGNFNFDESAMIYASAIYCAYACNYLENSKLIQKF